MSPQKNTQCARNSGPRNAPDNRRVAYSGCTRRRTGMDEVVRLSVVVELLILGVMSSKPMSAGGGSSWNCELSFGSITWKGSRRYYRDLAQAFERKNPGHRVVIQLEDWNTAHDKIAHWITAGEGPDLTIVPDVWLAKLICRAGIRTLIV